MNAHDASEQAYKRGYSDGFEAAAKKIAEGLSKTFPPSEHILVRALIQEIILKEQKD